jgi:phage recombination protein Bet
MSGTAVALLPTDGDSTHWTAQEKALVEAAGLVRTVNRNTGQKELADRPTVEAFLQHCMRTQLDPIARQIYAIYRGGKWGIQISIDGARLVAERTGQYEGQTTPEFTDDGETWKQVWLSSEPPKAARVGVFRRGFREPLYAIALWDAYAVYDDVWENNRKTGEKKISSMWSKMGPLMLAKCAEMLALRKAFPQDLSGLYSTEEMGQAGEPAAAARVDPTAPAAAVSGARTATTAAEQPIAPPTVSRDWAAAIEATTSLDACGALYREADAAGELGLVVGLAGDNDDGSAHTVMDLFWARKRELAAETPEMVQVSKGRPVRRQWVRDARGKSTRTEVQALYVEAQAAGVDVGILDELEAIAKTLPDPEDVKPQQADGWAKAEADAASTEWPVAQIPSADTPGILDETIVATVDEDEPF